MIYWLTDLPSLGWQDTAGEESCALALRWLSRYVDGYEDRGDEGMVRKRDRQRVLVATGVPVPTEEAVTIVGRRGEGYSDSNARFSGARQNPAASRAVETGRGRDSSRVYGWTTNIAVA